MKEKLDNEFTIISQHAKKFKVLTISEELELTRKYKIYDGWLKYLDKKTELYFKNDQDQWTPLSVEYPDQRNLLEFLKNYKSKAIFRNYHYILSLHHKYRDKLLNHNLRLVIYIAKKPVYQDKGLDLIDLIQEGCRGFLHALDKFDPAKGNKLSTYATIWISQYIGRAIENISSLVRIPNNKLALISKIKTIYKECRQDLKETPSAAEIANKFKKKYKKSLSIKEIEDLGRLHNNSKHASLDEQTGEDDEGLSVINYLTCREEDKPEEKIELFNDSAILKGALSLLTKEESDYIMIRYGFIDLKERKLKEMSQFTGQSAKNNEKFEMQTLEKLRNVLNMNKFNTEILCDLLMVKHNGDIMESSLKVQKIMNISLLAANKIVIQLPARIKTKVSQHMAEEVIQDLKNHDIIAVKVPVV